MGTLGKRRSGPWYAEDRARIVFEGRSREYFPGLRSDVVRMGGKRGLCYYASIDVPYYEARSVKILFAADRAADAPIIVADGPIESPHRFSDLERTRLCIWHPSDPRESRWTVQDGLVSLLALIKLHLFREGWWRDTGGGEWLGPEANHGLEGKSNGSD